MKRFLDTLSHYKVRFAWVLLLGLSLNVVFALADPLIMKLLIDEGLIKRNLKLFGLFAALVVVFGAAARGAFFFYELQAQKLKNRLSESLSLRMLKSYFELPYAEIVKSDTGYFVSRLYDEPASVAQGIGATLIGLCLSVVTLAAGFAVSLYLAWKITLLLSLIVPVLFHLSNRFSPKIQAASENENEEQARLREVLGRSVDSYKTVRVFGLYPSVQQRILRHLQTYLDVFYERIRTSGTYQTLGAICLSFAEAVVLVAAGYEVVAGSLTIGGLFAYMSSFWKVIGSAKEIITQVPELSRLNSCIGRLREFERQARPVKRGDSGSIELENVNFRYNGKNVLDSLNLSIGTPERVLIVGPNGSGKTTLGHLMVGFLDPSEGAIRVPRLEQISAMLAPFHFVPGNLKDNVNYDELTEEKRTFFWDLVRGLGLESRIDADASSELSEGEKKKCQILMTLLKDAEIYVFDEPLANIDAESRDAIVRTQLEHTRGKTLISIMHGDEKYYGLFDRVVALKQGSTESA
jgi:ABC-type bacteriocin/lantibiotic exporter with double-glycine peptidase domain